MKKPNKEQIQSLLNTLQLCIKTAIADHRASDNNILQLKFSSAPQDDKGFEYFQKLVDGEWDEKKTSLTIKNADSFLSTRVFNFLMLSRLQEKNMRMLAKLDTQYQPFVKKTLGDHQDALEEIIEDLEKASAIVFSHVEKQQITLRELSHKSGFSQVALSNFKAGKDIRLSSLLKILKALKLTLTIGN